MIPPVLTTWSPIVRRGPPAILSICYVKLNSKLPAHCPDCRRVQKPHSFSRCREPGGWDEGRRIAAQDGKTPAPPRPCFPSRSPKSGKWRSTRQPEIQRAVHWTTSAARYARQFRLRIGSLSRPSTTNSPADEVKRGGIGLCRAKGVRSSRPAARLPHRRQSGGLGEAAMLIGSVKPGATDSAYTSPSLP